MMMVLIYLVYDNNNRKIQSCNYIHGHGFAAYNDVKVYLYSSYNDNNHVCQIVHVNDEYNDDVVWHKSRFPLFNILLYIIYFEHPLSNNNNNNNNSTNNNKNKIN